ncbi:hypothetical protein Fmac_007348 [Flemingia macrophylla]|uniref:Myb-like domain-containing protein n=1 Tax=Flemingia macrophylla TaxID=520843 RepID=A0ABD1MVD0_9FABA
MLEMSCLPREKAAANRWPREETMALLKIRSDMEVAFRDSNPKAPLWEQVSRKLEEVGYQRSAKKCKEKFENIYKYHRRTKEGRCKGSKAYRFFNQLEALEHSLTTVPHADTNVNAGGGDHSSSRKQGKKNMTQFLEGLMREVIEKQETLQRNFMEVLDKCERERMAREEAWKREELARLKKERQLLAQERSVAAAKDEAVLAFLKKFAQAQGTVHLLDKTHLQNNQVPPNDVTHMAKKGQECATVGVGASRWPKDEVEALIRLRTRLEVQAHGNNNNNNTNKGPLWEEISSAMKSLGYDRSAKRCKEKWENINKYFKRMKEKNKRKPQDSKTCPYYHHLEALYSKRHKKVDESNGSSSTDNNINSGNDLKPEELLLHIMESQEERQQQMDESSSERENTDENEGDNEDDSGYQDRTVDIHSSPASIANELI